MVYIPELPFDISCISSVKSKRYMLFDIELITWLRREHHILGVLVGTLPQAPSQNLFLGLPLELMPEEARLLVDKGIARVVDDSAWFLKAVRSGIAGSKSNSYRDEVMKTGIEAAELARKANEAKIAEGKKKMMLNQQTAATRKQSKISEPNPENNDLFNDNDTVTEPSTTFSEPNTTLSEPFAVTQASAGALAQNGLLYGITPAETSSYLLFKTLHGQGYFMSPGLRFGCQFMAYPGDPLRYHSHFLAVAVESDKRISLIDIIGGGRLATAVKKSFLLGSVVKTTDPITDAPHVETYPIEWAAI